MNFAISDKVVCVDDSPSIVSGIKLLNKGQIYVISGFDPTADNSCWPIGTVSLYLVGIPMEIGPSGFYVGWASCRFRKLTHIQAENAAKRQRRLIAKVS